MREFNMSPYDILVSKWKVSGLLEGLNTHEEKVKMSYLLENQLQWVERLHSDDAEDFFFTHRIVNNISLPLVRRVFDEFLPEIGVVTDFEAFKAGTPKDIVCIVPNYECDGYYQMDCEEEYVAEISKMIENDIRKTIDSLGKMYYVYTPFLITEIDNKTLMITISGMV